MTDLDPGKEYACCAGHFPHVTDFVELRPRGSLGELVTLKLAAQRDGIDRLGCIEAHENARRPKTTYVEISAHGDFGITHGTYRDRITYAKQGINNDVWNESWTEFANFPRLRPVQAYGWFLLGGEDFKTGGRRLNTVANSMMWELTGPIDKEAEADLRREYGDIEPPSDQRAKTRFRGNVVFQGGMHRDLDAEQLDLIRTAYHAATGKLRAKGWM